MRYVRDKRPPRILLMMRWREAQRLVSLSDEEGIRTFFDEKHWREAKIFYQKEIERIERDLKEGNYAPPLRRRAA